MKKMVGILTMPFVAACFWLERAYQHQFFLFNMKNERLGSPNLFARILIVCNSKRNALQKVVRLNFINYAFKKYGKFISRHYSKGGWGYLDLSNLSEAECIEKYRSFTGRMAYFLEHNRKSIPYKNGDSFLDMGCGMGQNIQVVVEKFPNSKIKGFDLNEPALRLIRFGCGNNANVTLEPGSALDVNYLKSYPSGSVDHVFMSHVFSVLILDNVDETRRKRQEIVDEMIRIASKSVMILDSVCYMPEGRNEFVIEQNTRCVFTESLADYFQKHSSKGELSMFFSPVSSALLFQKG